MRDIKIINIVDDFSFKETINPIKVEKASNELLLGIYSQNKYDRDVIILDEPNASVDISIREWL